MLADVVPSKPGIAENCFSSGVATEVDMVSGLAPESVAMTMIVGES